MGFSTHPRRGLIGDVAAAWRGGFDASIRDMAGRGIGESQLLVFAFAAAFIGFVTGLPGAARQAATLGVDAPMSAVIGGRLFAAIFVAPLLFYTLAALSGLATRAFARPVAWRDARLALFWALLVASPLLVVNGLATAFLPTGAALTGIQWITTVAFLWIWSSCLAGVTPRTTRIQIFIFIICLIGILLAILLSFAPN